MLRWKPIAIVFAGLIAAVVLAGSAVAAESKGGPQAADLLGRIGTDRGICVLLAPVSPDVAMALAERSHLLCYMQLADEADVREARTRIDRAGLLGTRVYVEQGPIGQLHVADNLADAVVAPAEAESHLEELLRAVRPLGKVLLPDKQVVKPWPEQADDWTHPYHGADNNPLSADRLARAPYLTQFLAEPWYVPFPEVTVTSHGRVFKAFGHVGYKRRDWPWLNTLVAINGYNGTMLWKRSLEEGFNIHRNTMIATPQTLYLADSRSCKLLDAASGDVKGEVVAPPGATGRVWKWMALQGGVLYALVGEEEFRDPTLRGERTAAGWPWRPMTPGYDRPDYPWGQGRTFFAVDVNTRRVLWTHVEDRPIDGRAVCMRNGRIYCYSHKNYLACLDAKEGKPLWRCTDKALLEAIGEHDRAQTPPLGFSSSAYMKCSDEAIFFAGPQRTRLVAASTEDGHLLWDYPHGNFQLILRGGELYAMGRTGPSKLFEPLTGTVLADLGVNRGNCTRATATPEAIFTRGYRHGGTMRLAFEGNRPARIALMRPACHDGVIVAGGNLYWGPWMCDCSLSLVGIICLGPAGDFHATSPATERERLVRYDNAEAVAPLEIAPGDWPAYRADNRRSAAAPVEIPRQVDVLWTYRPRRPIESSMPVAAAPVTAGGLVFLSGGDGAVRAVEAGSGKVRWSVYAGGPIMYPPAVADGRLWVGSCDGWIHAFEAATGRRLWKFRAAPAERKIAVYGRLSSTWPVAGGVLVEDGVCYAAAGIASYDGTHVYALDAATGRIRWQNNDSGRLLAPDRVTGVSVQGHLLLHEGRLYLAGGNVVSPAVYDTANGRCLNTLEDEWTKAPRGRELSVIGGKVTAFDRLLYSPKEYWTGRYFARHFVQADSGDAIVRGTQGRIVRVDPQTADRDKPKSLRESDLFDQPEAMALGTNAVVVAGRVPSKPEEPKYAVAALALEDGRPLWRRGLPAMPVSWGLATDAAGRIVVTLVDGRAVCLGVKQ